MSSSFDNLQNFPDLKLYKNNNSFKNNNIINNNIIPENSNNMKNLNENILINNNLNLINNNFNGMNLQNSYNGGLVEDLEKNRDNNISKEEFSKNNIDNSKLNDNDNISLNIDKINEIKNKYPQLQNFPNEKLQELIDNKEENLDKVLTKLILSMSTKN